jgi:Fe-S oxidoreductase
MRGIVEARVEAGPTVAEELHFCLGCRACETACPSGVEYGAMLEHARSALVESGARRGAGPWLERWLLAKVVARPRARAFFFGLLRMLQRLRLDVVAKPLLPRALRSAVEAAPRVPARRERRPLPELTEAVGERRGRVVLLEGCVMRETFGEVNRATAAVLSRSGYDVLAPEGQGCCGALQAHAGDLDTARTLARSNIEAWRASEVDAVIVNSAGCGAALRGLEHWLSRDELVDLPAVKDVCEFLDEVGLREPLGPVEARVCYDDPCHLVHGQGVSDAPRRLLDAIPGLERVELPDASACCGAAGTYNITHRETSRRVLAPKLDSIARCAPEIVATGNPGCMLQIASGLRGRGLAIEVVHPIELIERATRPSA